MVLQYMYVHTALATTSTDGEVRKFIKKPRIFFGDIVNFRNLSSSFNFQIFCSDTGARTQRNKLFHQHTYKKGAHTGQLSDPAVTAVA